MFSLLRHGRSVNPDRARTKSKYFGTTDYTEDAEEEGEGLLARTKYGVKKIMKNGLISLSFQSLLCETLRPLRFIIVPMKKDDSCFEPVDSLLPIGREKVLPVTGHVSLFTFHSLA